MSLGDKVTGKAKQAIGDITDNASMKREGGKEQEKGEAKEDLARSEQQADQKADEVANLERNT